MVPQSLKIHVFLLIGLVSSLRFEGCFEALGAEPLLMHQPVLSSSSEADDKAIEADFFDRLKSHRSIEHRKQELMADYVALARHLKSLKAKTAELDAQMSSAEKSAPADATSAILQSLRRQITRKTVNDGRLLQLVVKEYDVMARLEDLRSSQNINSANRLEALSETRALREELAAVRLERQLENFAEDLREAIGHIELQLIDLSY